MIIKVDFNPIEDKHMPRYVKAMVVAIMLFGAGIATSEAVRSPSEPFGSIAAIPQDKQTSLIGSALAAD